MAMIIIKVFTYEKSGNAIIKDIDNRAAILKLKYNLEFLENKLQKNDLSLIVFDSINNLSNGIIKDLKYSDNEIDSFKKNHNKIYDEIRQSIVYQNDTTKKPDLQKLFNSGISYKSKLLRWQEKNIKRGLQQFYNSNKIYPRVIILLFIIGAIIILISIFKFYELSRESRNKSVIIDEALKNTNDKLNFFKPVYDDNNKIIDFFVSTKGVNDLPFPKFEKSDKRQLLSEVFSFYKESGLLEQLIHSYKNNIFFENVLEFPEEAEKSFYNVRYFPFAKGIQVVFSDLTEIYKKQEELEQLNRELNIKTKLFEEAEQSAKLGSYIWYMDEDKTIMSDNVYRILGYEPHSMPMSAKKFREFTHPNDLQLYDKTVENALRKNIPVKFVFRIITKDGKTKHLYTKGGLGKEYGKQIMIGIIQDVSEKIKTEQALKEKNLELSRKVEELDSFNHIVSHDLQEPLRKIQMFISRIEDHYIEQEENNPNHKFFEKIVSSVKRMRTLINNLLAYSRIDNQSLQSEMVDLNHLVNDIFDEVIESNPLQNITFNVSGLPKIYAIPFLVEQLFKNLIENSVKYKREHLECKIRIESIKIHNKQIPANFMKTHLYYHQIKVIDNGIGFNQEYSKDIFKIFNRLHSKSEYKGTGIGLAICKKIVTRHNGYIYANSIKDKGSIFTIYFPSGKQRFINL